MPATATRNVTPIMATPATTNTTPPTITGTGRAVSGAAAATEQRLAVVCGMQLTPNDVLYVPPSANENLHRRSARTKRNVETFTYDINQLGSKKKKTTNPTASTEQSPPVNAHTASSTANEQTASKSSSNTQSLEPPRQQEDARGNVAGYTTPSPNWVACCRGGSKD